MPRYITLFDKKTDRIALEYEVENDIAFFKSMFDVPEDDPLLYYVYEIKEEHKAIIEKRFGVNIDLNKYIAQVFYLE